MIRGASLTSIAAVAVAVTLLGGGAAQAAGAADRPPGRPTGLSVDDRTNPLTVSGTPRFGWLPHDRDGDEVQTAYQVVVSRERGGVVWDSGRVSSSDQSWVPYAGPSLASGATYRWTVRTWDRHGLASPFAGAARFDTGLADADWSGAQWIRRATSGNDASNDYTLARRQLTVHPGSPVVRARAYVAAMGDWALHVDGRQVGRSSSYGYPGEGRYDAYDLTPYARAGRPLAVGVLYHYWSCKCQGRANGPTPPEGPSGLLVKVVVDHADGSHDLLVSDGGWRLTKDTAELTDTLTYRNGDAGDRVEYYDARGEIAGWDTAGFDDSGWRDATVIGPHPRPNPADCSAYEGQSSPCAFTHLSASQAHVATRTVHPASVTTLKDGTVVADFGRVYAAVPVVRIADGVAGRTLTMTTSYRRTNTTLAAAASNGDRAVRLAHAADIEAGDRVTVDAPADGYGAGDPEVGTVTAVDADGTGLTLARPLRHAHAAGSWVEGSRAGTSKLDTQGSDMRFAYTEKGGDQTAQPFTYWGWRYLQISDPGERLTASDLTMLTQSTDAPAGHAATFHSDNSTLVAVVDLMQHSARYAEENTFLDTPTREKGQFLGDTVDESFASMTSLGERSLTREAIEDFIRSQARYWNSGSDAGRLNAVYPNGDAKRDIPDYTEMFPEWVMRYYLLTGDRSLLRDAYPTMKNVADYIWSAVDDSGLVYQLPGGSGPYQYGIIDWPAAMRYDTVVDGNGAETVVNALAAGALRATADAAGLLGKAADASTYGAHGQSLVTAMRAKLRDPATGRFSDGLAMSAGHPRIDNYSEHAQTYAIDYGVAPAGDYAALGAYVASQGMKQGPMDLRQLEEALRIADRPDALVSLLTDPRHDGPAQVLAEGGTFLWEQWHPGCATAPCGGADVDQSSSESFSHGWGSAGVTAILEGLLGIRVTGAGAATVEIAPPDKGLRHASGTVWTERGPVTVSWTRTGHGMTLRATLPDNVGATVSLPDAHGGRTVVHAGSGTSTFATG